MCKVARDSAAFAARARIAAQARWSASIRQARVDCTDGGYFDSRWVFLANRAHLRCATAKITLVRSDSEECVVECRTDARVLTAGRPPAGNVHRFTPSPARGLIFILRRSNTDDPAVARGIVVGTRDSTPFGSSHLRPPDRSVGGRPRSGSTAQRVTSTTAGTSTGGRSLPLRLRLRFAAVRMSDHSAGQHIGPGCFGSDLCTDLVCGDHLLWHPGSWRWLAACCTLSRACTLPACELGVEPGPWGLDTNMQMRNIIETAANTTTSHTRDAYTINHSATHAAAHHITYPLVVRQSN